MAEKRLIDANALKDDTFILNSWDAPIVRAWLDDQPTVDAVEVVRCADCRNCTAFQAAADSECMLYCVYHSFRIVDPTDYCSWGERRAARENL